jgi:asparagine synthase (glutamine-hydrolysing)
VDRKKNPYPKVQHPRYTELVTKMLREALEQNDSVLHELLDEQQLHTLIKDDISFQTPWFGQLMSRPQLMAYLVQLDLWVRRYNVQFML